MSDKIRTWPFFRTCWTFCSFILRFAPLNQCSSIVPEAEYINQCIQTACQCITGHGTNDNSCRYASTVVYSRYTGGRG